MKLCWALVSFSCATPFLYVTASTTDLPTDNNGASDNTKVIRVASLSATFERQCKF
jgi:hypothetical protein